MRLHVLQHVEFEGPGNVREWARDRGHELSITGFYRADPLPKVKDVDALLVMGGPMSIFDEAEFPWLVQEKLFLREFLASGKAVIGICLGSQLIADALGAKVYPNALKEIGWLPVEAEAEGVFAGLASELMVFHWHGDTFDLPSGARVLARSQATKIQAYQKQNILGLQCHFEINEPLLDAMVDCGREELHDPSPYVQSEKDIRAGLSIHAQAVKHSLFAILDRFFHPR